MAETFIMNAQLEIDPERGVVYVHFAQGVLSSVEREFLKVVGGLTMIRIQQIPREKFDEDGFLTQMIDLTHER